MSMRDSGCPWMYRVDGLTSPSWMDERSSDALRLAGWLFTRRGFPFEVVVELEVPADTG